MSSTLRRSHFYERWWTALIVFALLRSLPFFVQKDCFSTDPDAYLALADQWARHGIFAQPSSDEFAKPTPTAYRPPLYPWLLSWFSHDKSQLANRLAVFHIALGTATAWLTWSVAKTLLAPSSALAAWLAGTAVAIDPILLRQSTLIMTETAAAFAAVFTWWLWVQGFVNHERRLVWFSGLGLGVLFGLNGLLRSTNIVWLPLISGLWLCDWLQQKRFSLSPSGFRINWRFMIALWLGWAFATLPWAVRNYGELGRPILSTTHGGYTLLLANNPVLYEHFDQENWGRNWNDDAFHRWWESQQPTLPLNELENDRLANKLALQTIREHPWIFAKACLARCGWFWAGWPSSEQASVEIRWIVGLWYVTVYFFAGWAVYRIARRAVWARRLTFDIRWFPAIALIAGLTIVHSVFWSNMRMRGPIMPMVLVLAASAFRRDDVTNFQGPAASERCVG